MRTFLIALLSLLLCDVASAQMTSRQMREARDAARQAGQSAAQFELCRINSTRLKNKIVEFAEDACDASTRQVSDLEDTFDSELSDHKSALRGDGYRCTWSYNEAQAQFDNVIRALQRKISAGNC